MTVVKEGRKEGRKEGSESRMAGRQQVPGGIPLAFSTCAFLESDP
jgi:hypothetical protein